MRAILKGAVAGLVVLTTFLFIRTARFDSKQVAVSESFELLVDADAPARRLARSLTFPTVSYEDPSKLDPVAFLGLHEFIVETYPRVHASLSRETVAEWSLLYTWLGSRPELEPVVLMGHLDVVPVIPGTESSWTHPPFDGVLADGFVWGRGAVDNKSSVMAALEAVERLLGESFQPQRTVYLAFGHDEEVGGGEGAAAIAELLAERTGGKFALVLDEGGAMADGQVPGIDGIVALVGIAEKGAVSLELSVEGAGGHSSTPPAETSIGILSRAVTELESNPFPMRLDGATLRMFEYLGPELSFGRRFFVANVWLFEPLMRPAMARTAPGAAMMRTTTAATIFRAGVKANVLPIDATAVVNFRILPGDTVDGVVERVTTLIGDERVKIRTLESREPSPMSAADSEAFTLVARTIREVVADPSPVVAPYLVVGGTDARYYSRYSPNVFRFLPVVVDDDTAQRVHGTDERISVESFAQSVRFFIRLIQNAAAL